MREALTQWLYDSPSRHASTELLGSVPGLPPVLQTIHLLGLAVIMGSIVMLSLRTLGWAAHRQHISEMLQRLLPWWLLSLPVMLFSAMPFLLARPQRYIMNPVFVIKFWVLLAALCLSVWMIRCLRGSRPLWVCRLSALLTLCAWILTALAGRWIAYADYLFWPG